MSIPPGWNDDGFRLTAPNGQTVVRRFRWYILTHTWAPDDWPLEAEHYDEPLDITQPEQGGGIVQYFSRSILAWQESSHLISELSSGAIALAWRQQAEAVGETVDLDLPGFLSVSQAPRADTAEERERLARIEKQVELLLGGLRAGTKPGDLASSIEEQIDMVARDTGRSKPLYSPFSSPRLLLRWLFLLIGLLLADTLAWAISALIHGHAVIPLPLLTLATVALSAFFYFLIAGKQLWHS